MQDTHPDNGDKHPAHNVLILQAPPRNQNLMKVNRYLLYLVLCLTGVVFFMGLLLWPTKDPLDNLQAKHRPLTQANPALSEEISALKGQVAGLVSGSIESKLRTLEESIRNGSTNNALGTLQDLKRDVKVLQAYSEPKPAFSPEKVGNEALIEEVSHLKRLTYLTLASASLMFAAIAGLWINKRYRLGYRKKTYLQNQKK